MLDKISLLEAGNEELIRFVWKTFAKWQQLPAALKQPSNGMFPDLKGLMRRNRFPYAARTKVKVIRHAVSMDERRTKFRQDVISEAKPSSGNDGPLGCVSIWRDNVFLPHHNHHQHHNSRLSQSAQQPRAASPPASFADEKVDDVLDVEEVWFPGRHIDIAGGWPLKPGEYALSHLPLVWMVQSAQKAGLRFDTGKLRRFDCSGASTEDPV
ncbi:hypothetical protein Asppvi_001972 [Aspergillus pseudoviridinutans]|uniref:T6SS Phospholipase effector Tle1-like catalytic domain-containing protein n=1 Tax=Aspergillus pseudoviridinutans TaxID=1517512 RepID=A0A9P3EY33_9EURO|nr:uncharacterized protein Asppvi_001972 [Aspergillus pseudoviridinutans]GIJ92694.1 hypothetical protein Asppvi_001972 [Aspergillus pseudoviridinutans]